MLIPWINSIALNCFRGSLRKTAREERFDPETHDVSVQGINVASIDVAKILRACAPKTRRIFQAQLDGEETKDIARQHGVSTLAMRIRLHRARRETRDLMSRPLAA